LNFEQFLLNSPKGYQVVAVENPIDARPLETFCHPRKAIYLLGSEAGGLPKKILDLIPLVVKIDSAECLNVCTAGSIVMYDRNSKIIQKRMSGI
jgi:tRNA (guanosine-2'-O-)-methyltransferase